MALLIVAGSLLSWALNREAGRIALASLAAFAAAGTVDTLVFQALQGRSVRWRINGSNSAAAGVDSVLFAWLAFGALPWALVAGQWAAKVGGGALWAWVLGAWVEKGEAVDR